MAYLSDGGAKAKSAVPTLTTIMRGLRASDPTSGAGTAAFLAAGPSGGALGGAGLGTAIGGTPAGAGGLGGLLSGGGIGAGLGQAAKAAAAPAAPQIAAPATDPAGPPSTDPTTATPPDYWGQIINEPGYQQLQRNLSAQGISAATTRKGQTDQAIAQFGEVPDLTSAIKGMGLDPDSPMFQAIFGDIDQTTVDAANKLTAGGLTTTAGLDRQHATDIQSLLDNMAAHGTVQSGGTGVGLGQADQAYSGNQYNARTSLINYLTGVQSAFNQQQQAAAQQLQQGAADAVARLMAQNPALGTGTPPPPSSQPLNLAAGLG